MRKKRGMIFLSASDEEILTTLAGKELYGLEIFHAIIEASKGKRNIAIGSLYPTLTKLAANKLIKSRWREDKNSEGARRRYHKITPAGEQALQEAQAYRQALAEWGRREVENG